MVIDLILVGFSCFYKGYKYNFFCIIFFNFVYFYYGVNFIFQICFIWSIKFELSLKN